MRSVAVVAGLVAAANAMAYNYTAPPYETPSAPSYETPSPSAYPPVYETTVVSEYTTVCPGPTEVPIGPGKTITVSESTTLTITDCPCTISKPVYTPGPSPPAYTPGSPAPPAYTSAPYYPPANSSAPYVPVPPPSGTGVPTSVYPTGTPSPSEFPGAAGKAGLSLLAVAGALAAFL